MDENGNYTGTSSYSGATQNNLDTFYEIPELVNPRSDKSKIRHQTIVNLYNGKWTNKKTHTISGGKYYVAGREGYTEAPYGTPHEGANAEGTAVFHVVSDVDFIGQPDDPIEINLYGKAAFINNEAFRGGKTTMQNVKINIHKDNNTVFNIIGAGVVYTAAFRDVLTGWGGIQYTTKFLGSADINVNTKTNTIYAINHYSPGTQIENTGDIVFNGASNIGFSFLTYVPDKSKYICETVPNWSTIGEATLDDYKNFLKKY